MWCCRVRLAEASLLLGREGGKEGRQRRKGQLRLPLRIWGAGRAVEAAELAKCPKLLGELEPPQQARGGRAGLYPVPTPASPGCG